MQQSRRNVGITVLGILATFAMSTIGGLSFLFTLPLLMLHKRALSTGKCLWIQGVAYLGVLAYAFYPYIGFLTPENYGIIFFGIMYTLSIAAEALIYTAMDFRSSSVLRKLVVASIPAFVICGGFSVWISSPVAVESLNGFKLSVTTILENAMPEMVRIVNPEAIVGVLVMLSVPMGVLLGAVPVLISEFSLNSRDEQWQEDMAYMKLPGVYSVFLLLCALLVVPVLFLEKYPKTLAVLGWNCGMGLLLHFAINGASVLYAIWKKRNPSWTIGKVVFLLVVACFIPGVNFGVFICLCIIALLENWIKFR